MPANQTSDSHTHTRAARNEEANGLAINDSWYVRFAVRIALKTTARLFKRTGTCIPITKGKVVKVGKRTHLTEATTMQFIAPNTSLAVPKVYCAFVHKGQTYLVMERIQGVPLDSLDDERRHRACATLKTALESMRNIQPTPGTGVESCCGGSLTDPRIPWAPRRFGPFQTIQEFHLWLRKGMTLQDLGKKDSGQVESRDMQDLRDMIATHDSSWPAPVFTHGDLNGSNILVRRDDVPVVIDWECAGWYPTYWEYTSAIWTGHVWTRWPMMVDEFLDPAAPEIIKMEELRNRCWGDF